jgi:peptidyl-tRNA hydrolase
MIKMYCIFNPEAVKLMGGNRGKCAAQAGHAYLHAWWDAQVRSQFADSELSFEYVRDTLIPYYENNDARKIGLIGESEEQLRELEAYYKDKCGVSLVEDCGYTIFEQPTITCLGIGPIEDDQKCEILKNLPLFI